MLARTRRRGFTLFEVVLVCAVLVLVATITYPSLRGMYPYYKLNGGVDAVRAAWAHARARAIEEGRPYRFSIEEGGSHYRVAPDHDKYWSGSPPADDPDGNGLILEQSLPSGVVVSTGETPATPPPENVSSKEENTPASGNWTTTAVFLPDGTAKPPNVRLVFQIHGVRPTALHLRALTGTVSVQAVNP